MANIKNWGQEFIHYRFLLSELVKKGIVLKYRRSYLGLGLFEYCINYNWSS